MKKLICTLSIILAGVFTMSAQSTDQTEVISALRANASQARYDSKFEKAENLTQQALTIFNGLPVEVKAENSSVLGELYYDLARYRSLQDKRDEAVAALELAVDNGWSDYTYTTSDNDLKNIKRDKKYKAIVVTMNPAS